jgi:hypothetical protein
MESLSLDGVSVAVLVLMLLARTARAGLFEVPALVSARKF